MRPSLPSMTKPEPSEETLRSAARAPPWWLKKSSKNSSKGEPFGTCGSGSPCGPLIVWLVETLTTASINCSATGATDCGPRVCAARTDRSEHRESRPEDQQPKSLARADGPAAARRMSLHQPQSPAGILVCRPQPLEPSIAAVLAEHASSGWQCAFPVNATRQLAADKPDEAGPNADRRPPGNTQGGFRRS